MVLPCTKDINAEDLATIFYDDFVRYMGMPNHIISDRGSLFTIEFWSILCHNLAVKRKLSTAYHPQTDGQTERQNQTLEYYLRAYTNWRIDCSWFYCLHQQSHGLERRLSQSRRPFLLPFHIRKALGASPKAGYLSLRGLEDL